MQLECKRFKKEKNSFEQEDWIFTAASKNLQDKMRELNVHDSFLVSILCGLIELLDKSAR